MRRPFFQYVLLAFLLSGVPVCYVRAESEVIRVPADYPTIQEAVNAAAPGSMIFIASGVYHECVVVNKTLMLVGENRANTIIDGDGGGTVIRVMAHNVMIENLTIRGGDVGIKLEGAYNSTLSRNIITLHKCDGILMINSTRIAILDNIITKCGTFIPGPLIYGGAFNLINSSGNIIEGNVALDNIGYGLLLQHSTYNQIRKNTLSNSYSGIFLTHSTWNTIYHNNFVNNTDHVFLYESYNNTWDYNNEGNYWDSYNGLDDGSGGRVAGDGVGDTKLPHFGVDNYPLINPYDSIPIVWENEAFPIGLLSNSTISSFRFIHIEKKLTFTLTAPPNTIVFCNLTIPKSFMIGNPWTVLVDGISVDYVTSENQTHSLLHLQIHKSTSQVVIQGTWVVPEFPSAAIMPLLMILSMLAVIFAKKRLPRKLET